MISVISFKKNGLAATNPKPSKKNKKLFFKNWTISINTSLQVEPSRIEWNQNHILGPPSQK